MKFTRFLISRPVLTSMAFVAVAVLGIVAYLRIPVAELPNVNFPTVVVAVSDPGSNSTTIQQAVTAPLEQAINGVSGLTQVVGVSHSGNSRVVASFATGINVQVAAQQISAAIGRVQRHLPASASTANVTTINPNLAPLLQVQFTGLPTSQLVQLLNVTVAPDLRLVPGVGQINVTGGSPSQVNVVVNPTEAAARGISIAQINQALSSENILVGEGTAINGGQSAQVTLNNRPSNSTQLGQIIVGQQGQAPVSLSEVASISTGAPPSAQGNSYSTLNGSPTVAVSVIPADGVNQLSLDSAVRAKLAAIAPALPPSVHYAVTSDQTVFTRSALSATTQDIIFAIILASLVILLFLQSAKQTLIVFLAIPSSLLATTLMMFIFHFTLDLISLLAFTLLIGILVDDAVVVIENITRHLRLGLSPAAAALEGRKEIAAAAVALTLTDVVVFLPITFASGIVGQILIEFGVTVVFATLFSLLVSFSLTPMLAAKLLKPAPENGAPGQRTRFSGLRIRTASLVESLQTNYGKALVGALAHRGVVLVIAGLTVVGSIALVTTGRVGSSYIPQEDPGQINVALQMPAGTTLAATSVAVNEFSSKVLQDLPGIQDVVVSVGNGAGGLISGPDQGSATIDLVPKTQRSTNIATEEKLVSLIGESIPGLQAVPSVPSPLKAPGSSGLPIQISGPNLTTLSALAQNVAQRLQGVPGLSNATSNATKASPDWNVMVNQYQAKIYGVSTAEVASTLATAVGGSQVTSLQSPSGLDLPIYLYISGAPNLTIAQLENLPVAISGAPAAGGAGGKGDASASATTTSKNPTPAVSGGPPTPITLGQIASISHGQAPTVIKDLNGEPSVTVQGVVDGSVPLSQVTTAVNRILSKVNFPAGYQYSLGGNAAAQKLSFGPLLLALALSPVFIYILLAALYESFLLPLAVILGVPLATFGALAALALTHQSLNIFSLIGFLMLLGLVSKNAILMVDYTEILRARGYSSFDAVVLAAKTRLRPILMTTLTVVVAMLPVAFGSSSGSEYRSPMALVLVGGMTSSTLLTLFVIPVLYTLLDAARQRIHGGVAVAGRGHRSSGEILTPAANPGV